SAAARESAPRPDEAWTAPRPSSSRIRTPCDLLSRLRPAGWITGTSRSYPRGVRYPGVGRVGVTPRPTRGSSERSSPRPPDRPPAGPVWYLLPPAEPPSQTERTPPHGDRRSDQVHP